MATNTYSIGGEIIIVDLESEVDEAIKPLVWLYCKENKKFYFKCLDGEVVSWQGLLEILQ